QPLAGARAERVVCAGRTAVCGAAAVLRPPSRAALGKIRDTPDKKTARSASGPFHARQRDDSALVTAQVHVQVLLQVENFCGITGFEIGAEVLPRLIAGLFGLAGVLVVEYA